MYISVGTSNLCTKHLHCLQSQRNHMTQNISDWHQNKVPITHIKKKKQLATYVLKIYLSAFQ